MVGIISLKVMGFHWVFPVVYDLDLSVTLTLMQGHSVELPSTTKQAISIKLATMVGHFFYVTLTLKRLYMWLDQLVGLWPGAVSICMHHAWQIIQCIQRKNF